MKKWMMAALAALAMAANAQAGTITWGAWDSEPPTGIFSTSYTVYFIALGNSRYDFDYYSLNFNNGAPTLTSLVEGLPNGTTFETVQSDYQLVLNNLGAMAVYDTGDLPLNGWWAALFIDNTYYPERFGLDVFEISGMDEEISFLTEWYRLLNWNLPHNPMPPSGGDELLYADYADIRFDPREFGPIPEPTTGLLMLSGAAMLLLRRKRK